jgi:hypothetical protein
MNFQQRVGVFVQLGEFIRQISTTDHPKFAEAYIHNQWFTPENVRSAMAAWGNLLAKPKLEEWLAPYSLNETKAKTIAIIMAGNIPLVGFHDLLCILISGNKALIKLSDDDAVLPKLLVAELIRIEPKMADYITISDTRLPKDFDVVIATGSNNSNRYFEYYFRNKPALLRKSRTSVAVLTGNETAEEMNRLGDDIFTYFGLGCRNVSKIYVPEGYDLATFFEGIEPYNKLMQHHKYANNYNYHKAIFLLNLALHLDNNFIVVKEDEAIASPLGTLFYEYYTSLPLLKEKLIKQQDEIQCVVSKTDIEDSIPFGKSQYPELSDYADGVDTMRFLLDLAK